MAIREKVRLGRGFLGFLPSRELSGDGSSENGVVREHIDSCRRFDGSDLGGLDWSHQVCENKPSGTSIALRIILMPAPLFRRHHSGEASDERGEDILVRGRSG